MPLMDHFHPPLEDEISWDGFHSCWASRIADDLNLRWLPPGFRAVEVTRGGGRPEIDIATWEHPTPTARPSNGHSMAVATVPPPVASIAVEMPDEFEVQVTTTAIELISPSNKDRPETRAAFAAKCASCLFQGVSLLIVDVVTSRRANLHNELMRLMAAPPGNELPAEPPLYAVAYRPVLRNDKTEFDLWPESFNVGARLPSMPLRITGDTFAMVELEATYTESCRARRLPDG
jgi:hypothetical protein